MDPEPTGYKAPTEGINCCEHQELFIVQPAIRENAAWIEDGVIVADFGEDHWDDGEGATTLRCASCGAKWNLEKEENQ
jgi:hypothetical protein